MKLLFRAYFPSLILAITLASCAKRPRYPFSNPEASGTLAAMRDFAYGVALALEFGDIAVTDVAGPSGNLILNPRLNSLFGPDGYLDGFLKDDSRYFRFVGGVAVDTWGQPYRISLNPRETPRVLVIESAGPDGLWARECCDDLHFSIRLRGIGGQGAKLDVSSDG